jgi:hypothetical protein
LLLTTDGLAQAASVAAAKVMANNCAQILQADRDAKGASVGNSPVPVTRYKYRPPSVEVILRSPLTEIGWVNQGETAAHDSFKKANVVQFQINVLILSQSMRC